jgi:hypothetical protein
MLTMESWRMRELRWKRQAKKEKLKKLVGDVVGSVLFFGFMIAFCWLCMACSGYHWE